MAPSPVLLEGEERAREVPRGGSMWVCPHLRTLENARGNCHGGSSPPQVY